METKLNIYIITSSKISEIQKKVYFSEKINKKFQFLSIVNKRKRLIFLSDMSYYYCEQ